VKVSDAVHHAHQRGLIHRDLKPCNILVDETGQPKVLDFGVARVTDSDAQATMQTDVGQLVGTLAYMSPEQVLADPLELDTRSDVYALGVILYELLAGRLPYNISKKLHEALHAIREEDPSRLSSINRAYRGDIETIAAKALERTRTGVTPPPPSSLPTSHII
jgi:serine/threonine protein kinase